MSKRILIVSDAPFMRTMITNACTQFGSEVVCEAVSQSHATEAYRRFKPDIVFIDLCMWEQNDLRLLQALYALDPHANMIICASLGQKPLVLETALHGAKDFLFQPLSQEQVQRMVLRYV
jgi:two-component system chemotaxis response regulator CheY